MVTVEIVQKVRLLCITVANIQVRSNIVETPFVPSLFVQTSLLLYLSDQHVSQPG